MKYLLKMERHLNKWLLLENGTISFVSIKDAINLPWQYFERERGKEQIISKIQQRTQIKQNEMWMFAAKWIKSWNNFTFIEIYLNKISAAQYDK